MLDIRTWCALLLLCPCLTSCMVGPNFHSPDTNNAKKYTHSPLPAKTAGTEQDGKAGISQHFLTDKQLSADWWTLFHSKEINTLIAKGIENSPTLAAAKATLTVAQETLRAQTGNLLFPAFDANLSGERARISGLSFGSPGPSNVFNVFNIGASVSYLLDVAGGSRRQLESLQAQVDYQQYQMLAAYLTLTANIVTTAITMAALDDQIKATQALINEQEKQLWIIQKQLGLGGKSLQNVLSQQTLVSQTKALLPPLQTKAAQSRHALAVLIGDLPSESAPPKINLDKLTLPRNLPISLPSSLARQRPDVQAAEALLHAASAQIGVATANLFPQFNLSAAYGWTAQTPATLFTANGNNWAYGLGIAQPIFHGGALFAERRAAIAAYQQAMAQYRLAVLQAFQNVADALRALEMDALAFSAQKRAEISAKSAYLITKKQYTLGGASYLSLLNAQQQYQQTVINRIQAQAARYTDTAALFAALGGGWWNQSKLEHYK